MTHTQTILRPSLLETVSIPEIILWNVAEAEGANRSPLALQASAIATRRLELELLSASLLWDM